MKKIILFGVGTLGKSLIMRSSEYDFYITAVDNNPDRLNEVKNYVDKIYVIDIADEIAVKQVLDEDRYDIAIITLHRDFSNVLLLLIYIKEAGISRIIARAETAMQKNVLDKLEIKEIILPELEIGQKIADNLYLEQGKLLFLDKGNSILYIPLPKMFVKRQVKDLSIFDTYGIELLFIHRFYEDQGITKILSISNEEIEFIESDFLVLLGQPRRLSRALDDLEKNDSFNSRIV